MRFFDWLKRDSGWTITNDGDYEFTDITVKGSVKPPCPHEHTRMWDEGGEERVERCRACGQEV